MESVIEGLRGDRRAVTNAAQTIRLSGFLSRRKYRDALIASLLLAWNFETSHRARAAVLAALLQARTDYLHDYRRVVEDISKRFDVYEEVVDEEGIERGQQRLESVTNAVEAAAAASTAHRSNQGE
ncbi:hypothetical protein M2158_007978 [Streptomyces sp. SAI-144]|uniref:hypothetical protein n=1 Tax=Streptomyces sp. SAI-144 TaxID=2940544 RepID=UPI0024732199|nr:hypothetical protein [Streptomyces sp. SAI-144]MDH6439437.1 hypothetical protein [Streptomyces sp. SAI-144]